MSNPLQLIQASRLVAIIRLTDLTNAVSLSRALLCAGIVAQEFTLTNPRALDAVRAVLQQIEEFSNGAATIGVGSVRTEQQAKDSIDSGAQFLVSPVVLPRVTAYCVDVSVPMFSGAFTPTEIASAWDSGASIVKVFPARGLGADYIKDVLAPMPELKLMPTGGIDLNNMQDYFRAGATAVGIGGNLLNTRAIHECNWEQVTATARQYAARAMKVQEL